MYQPKSEDEMKATVEHFGVQLSLIESLRDFNVTSYCGATIDGRT